MYYHKGKITKILDKLKVRLAKKETDWSDIERINHGHALIGHSCDTTQGQSGSPLVKIKKIQVEVEHTEKEMEKEDFE